MVADNPNLPPPPIDGRRTSSCHLQDESVHQLIACCKNLVCEWDWFKDNNFSDASEIEGFLEHMSSNHEAVKAVVAATKKLSLED